MHDRRPFSPQLLLHDVLLYLALLMRLALRVVLSRRVRLSLWTAFEPVFPPSDESVRPTKGDIAQLDCSPDERVRPDLRDARGNAALSDCSPPDLGVATWLGQTPFPSPFPSEKIQQGRLLQLQLQLLIDEENHLIFFSLQRFFENLTA